MQVDDTGKGDPHRGFFELVQAINVYIERPRQYGVGFIFRAKIRLNHNIELTHFLVSFNQCPDSLNVKWGISMVLLFFQTVESTFHFRPH